MVGILPKPAGRFVKDLLRFDYFSVSFSFNLLNRYRIGKPQMRRKSFLRYIQ